MKESVEECERAGTGLEERPMPACGLAVAETRYAPGNAGPVTDVHSRFYLFIAGQARWECGGRRHALGADTLCHIPAGQTHRLEVLPNEPILAYVIRYRPTLLSTAIGSQLAAFGMLPIDLTATNVNQARVVRSIFQEMLFEQDARQEAWEELLHSRLIDLGVRILRLARRRGPKDLPVFEPGSDSTDRVARYALELKAHFFRQETIAQAAHSVGLGRRQFTGLFRKVTGQSWRQYILSLRLKNAAGLLVQTGRSVSAVAFESGFDDLSHFHHRFKLAYGCSPLTYREQWRIRLPRVARGFREPASGPQSPGFSLRGMKGWFWTPEQYLEEIEVLASLEMNFLMDCYGSMIISQPGDPWCNEWWTPMKDARKEAYARIIRVCRENKIIFCFALHPQLASPRPLDPGNREDVEAFYQHYAWAQGQGVGWFSVCLDGTSWGAAGAAAAGCTQAGFVNSILARLRTQDREVRFLFCPTVCWGDGTNPEHRAYLQALGGGLDPAVYVFWNGDSIVTPRVTRVAAESFRNLVQHRLFLLDNYPVNDGNPTLHLGPVSGREADLCEVIEGYLSNPMCLQNQINRIPLATCADYAFNPRAYDPARSIGQAIVRFAKSDAQQQALKDLVEAYPGFLVAGGGTGTNPVRGKLGSILAATSSRSAGQEFRGHIEGIYRRLTKLFPGRYPATRQTVRDDLDWMKQELAPGRVPRSAALLEKP
jgi:AraC-like DNA-binding protein/mannose-6-phosphate isomerase-like protein (cupin superfamily)